MANPAVNISSLALLDDNEISEIMYVHLSQKSLAKDKKVTAGMAISSKS